MSDEQAVEDSSALSAEPIPKPKVFISYSWSSPGHREAVRQWAERLTQDGIDVVIDIYDLKEGQDKYSFMERMVTDPTVTHVLVVCDRAYSEKADARKAGVGTESQIISREVYEKVEQSKFIPLVCEFSDEREPFLPLFLKSRIWVDFSSLEAVNENWERLVRVLFGKPLHQKPQIGNPPAYIAARESSPSNPASGKFSTLKQALLQGRSGVNIYRRDFLSACVEYADALRVRKGPPSGSIGAKIIEDSEKLKAVRNQIVDWVLLESAVQPSADFSESLIGLLEELYELKSRRAEVTSWNDSWFEAHSVFVYETFLYIIAALLKTGSYEVLHEVFASHYLRPKSQQHSDNKFAEFDCFYGRSEILRTALAPPSGRTYLSGAAELIKRQADRDDIPFSAVMEAELLVFMVSLIKPGTQWYPQTLYYASQAESPFFVRATQHKNFVKLATITGTADVNVLREAVKDGYQRADAKSWDVFRMGFFSIWSLMNMDKLDSLK
jgi:SEFIR domain-containing protein